MFGFLSKKKKPENNKKKPEKENPGLIYQNELSEILKDQDTVDAEKLIQYYQKYYTEKNFDAIKEYLKLGFVETLFFS